MAEFSGTLLGFDDFVSTWNVLTTREDQCTDQF